MDAAIQFDNQLMFRTEEVDDIRTQRVLPSELETTTLTPTELGPEPTLGRCHALTQVPCGNIDPRGPHPPAPSPNSGRVGFNI